MTEIDTRTAGLLDELLWHARHAQDRIELAARNQRSSLRRLPEATEGMLYAYHPTRDEYALLQRRVPAADVAAVFLQALGRDPNLPVQDFARLLDAHRDLRTRTVPSSLTVPVLAP